MLFLDYTIMHVSKYEWVFMNPSLSFSKEAFRSLAILGRRLFHAEHFISKIYLFNLFNNLLVTSVNS